MKKSILFVTLLLITMLRSAYASPAQNADIFTQSYMISSGLVDEGAAYIQHVDWSGDTCYAYLGDMSVYTYQPDEGLDKFCQLPKSPDGFDQTFVIIDEKTREQLNETVTYIVAGDDGLYGYNVTNGNFGHIDQEGIHWETRAMDMECLNPNRELFPSRVARSLLTENQLYVFSYANDGSYSFFGFDRTSGKSTEYKVEGAIGVCHEQGDNFLFLRRLNADYCISLLNTSTNTLTDLNLSMKIFSGNNTVGGLAYKMTNDEVYLAMNGQVYCSASGGDFEPIAYVPTETLMGETPAWILSDGRYVLCSMTGMYIRAKARELDHQQLVIRSGVWLPNAEELYRQKYPNVGLNFIRSSITSEEVAQMLITQDSSVDIFEVCVDYSFSSLVKKGFVNDMSTSQVIQRNVNTMSPNIADILHDEQGRIVAYPTQLRIWSCGIHEGYWQLAFGDRPLPSNMNDLMDAWIDWELEYAEEYPDIDFSIGFDYAQYCQQFITFFIQQNDTNENQPNPRDPVLINALNKLKQVYEIRLQSGRSTTETVNSQEEGVASILRFRAWDQAMSELSTTVALTSESTLYDMYMWDYTKVPITFAAGDEVKTDGTMFVYIINPYSQNIDAAIKFIECVSELESEPYVYYSIHPDCNTPYEKPNFEQWIESAVQEKAALEATMKKLDGLELSEKADIQAMIDYYDLYIANQENERWLISADTIAKYREMLKVLDLHSNSIYLGAPGTASERMIAELCNRYASGNLTMDTLLNEIGNKMRMMQLENR